MAVFPEWEKMPLELESEFLNGSVATTDTRDAAQATRWGGTRRGRGVTSGAATSEKTLAQLEARIYT